MLYFFPYISLYINVIIESPYQCCTR